MIRDSSGKGNAMQKKRKLSHDVSGLRSRAETDLKNRPHARHVEVAEIKPNDIRCLLHELQVHQIELEMQNAELLEARDRTDALLEKYTDLYDFAPVGFFFLDEQGRILEANLTGATLFAVERSRLINRLFSLFVVTPCRSIFLDFLAQTFEGAAGNNCEIKLLKEDGTPFWACLHGSSAVSRNASPKGCRLAVSDITTLKQAKEAQRLLENLSVSNEALKKEIAQRQAVEESLRKSERDQRLLLDRSRLMQEELRGLSHCILQTKEEERKRISRELHDGITQTLVGINVHLEALTRDTTLTPKMLRQKIIRTQRLVEKSVEIVHRFARELRPTSLDDLGLIITLHSYLNDFMKQMGIYVHFTAFTEVEHLNSDQRTALFRIAQQALTNVAQHAHASQVKVAIRKCRETVHVEIADNGKSFEVEQILNAKKNKRLGLIGMRERAEMVGGTFMIESKTGKGTTIHVQIPFNSKTQENALP